MLASYDLWTALSRILAVACLLAAVPASVRAGGGITFKVRNAVDYKEAVRNQDVVRMDIMNDINFNDVEWPPEDVITVKPHRQVTIRGVGKTMDEW